MRSTPRATTPTQATGNVFEKLTDPHAYTGHHKHRFDPDSGKGLGKSGRDTVQKGMGTSAGHMLAVDGKVTCISQLMRPDFYASDGGGGKKGGARRTQERSLEPTRAETEGTIFERLTDASLYTGHHRHRFDHETGKGKGLAGRDSLSKGLGTVSHVEIRPDDDRVLCTSELFRPHFKPHGGSNSARDKRRAKSPAPGQVTVPEIEAGSIFEKLTSPTSFTGAHRHRFDEEGRGLGLQGRDRIVKGDAGDAAYRVLALRDSGDDDSRKGRTGALSPRARSPRGKQSQAWDKQGQLQHQHQPVSPPPQRALVREV